MHGSVRHAAPKAARTIIIIYKLSSSIMDNFPPHPLRFAGPAAPEPRMFMQGAHAIIRHADPIPASVGGAEMLLFSLN
jgi:hypothetical protein